MSNAKYNSGRARFVGIAIPTPSPIDLSPSEFEGALAYGDDNDMYFADGTDWVSISGTPIRRPAPLEPVTEIQKRTMRLSPFLVSPGYTFTQEGVVFVASLNADMSGPFLTETVVSETANSYLIDLGVGVTSGQTFYWQGKYLASDDNESKFSRIFAQTYPFPIKTPVSTVPVGVEVGSLQITEYESGFEYPYGSTDWEIYTTSIPSGSPVVAANNNASTLALGDYIESLDIGETYYWRARYKDNSTNVSEWSTMNGFIVVDAFTVEDLDDNVFKPSVIVLSANNGQYIVGMTVLDSNDDDFDVI
jgi:hypothetical protein